MLVLQMRISPTPGTQATISCHSVHNLTAQAAEHIETSRRRAMSTTLGTPRNMTYQSEDVETTSDTIGRKHLVT